MKQELQQIKKDVFTAVLATLIIVIPASIFSGIVLLITRNNDACMYTLIGTCTLEILGWAFTFLLDPIRSQKNGASRASSSYSLCCETTAPLQRFYY